MFQVSRRSDFISHLYERYQNLQVIFPGTVQQVEQLLKEKLPTLLVSAPDQIKKRFQVDGNRIKVGIKGSISNMSLKVINSAGFGYTMKDKKDASVTSGGHGQIRTAIDTLTAAAMERIAQIISSNPLKIFVIRDLGAKYQRNSKIFAQLLRRCNNWSYIPERNNLNEYDRQYHAQNENRYNQFRATNNRMRAVRKAYYTGERIAQDSEIELVFSVDVIPYYIENKYLVKVPNRSYYIVGTNYANVRGRYVNANMNGHFSIFSRGGESMVKNDTRGNTQGYEHTFKKYCRAYQSMRMLHQQFFFDMTDDPASKLEEPHVPPVSQKYFYNISHALRNRIGQENKVTSNGQSIEKYNLKLLDRYHRDTSYRYILVLFLFVISMVFYEVPIQFIALIASLGFDSVLIALAVSMAFKALLIADLLICIVFLFKHSSAVMDYLFTALIALSIIYHHYLVILFIFAIAFCQLKQFTTKYNQWILFWRTQPNVVITNRLTGNQIIYE